MEANLEQYEDWEFLAKIMNEEVDEEERAKFYKTLAEDENLETSFNKFKEHWFIMDEVALESDQALTQAWEKQEAMITSSKEHKTPSVSFFMLKVAAILILTTGVIGLLKYVNNSDFTEIETLAGETNELNLPDGSKLVLNENSKVRYTDKGFKQNRQLIMSGEVYFDIASDPAHPFSIELNHEAKVTVLGTAFSIKSNSEENEIFVTEGKVSYASNNEPEYILRPDWIAKTRTSSQKTSVQRNNNPNKLSWLTKKMKFEQTPLSEALTTLEKTYQTKLKVKGDIHKLNRCFLTAEYNHVPFEDVLQALAVIYSLQIEPKTKTIVIEEEPCR